MAIEPNGPEKMIGLIRVSTGKQQESGLGLEAQRKAIEEHRKRNDGVLIRTYEGVESGMKDSIENRPVLKQAVAYARREGATLVFAKMDRLVRSIPVLSYLKTRQVKFTACDNPKANELTVDILVVIAANEGRMISERTKAALAEYKAGKHISKRVKLLHPNGVPARVVKATAGKLGASLPQCRNNLKPEARAKGVSRSAAVRRAKAIEADSDLAGDIVKWHKGGLTLRAIAKRLNERGDHTRRGGAFQAVQVKRVLDRLDRA